MYYSLACRAFVSPWLQAIPGREHLALAKHSPNISNSGASSQGFCGAQGIKKMEGDLSRPDFVPG